MWVYIACVKGSHVYRSEEVGPTEGNFVHLYKRDPRGIFFKMMIIFFSKFH